MKECSSNGGLISMLLPWWAVVFVVFCGCATLDKSECINADWQSIGYEDGARGYKTSHIGRHRRACAKHGITPDFDLYERGRRQGLLEWCTPRNGYRLGTQGKVYNGVCPPASAPAFMKAISQGRAFRDYENEVKKQDGRLEKMVAEQVSIDRDINALEAELIRDGISPRRRMKLLEEIRQLEQDQRYLISDIEDMEQTLEDMQANLEQMRSNNPYR
jgi:hypothetical protein